jgi:TetR/AcrR family transcriptional regulator, transcriptional repressor for nem operon
VLDFHPYLLVELVYEFIGKAMMMSDTRTTLLEHAQTLIQRVGVNAMSYNDLSKKVGIRKASIHYHFPKKDDLIGALQERCHIDYGNMYLEVVEGEGTAIDKLRRLVQIYIQTVKDGKLCLIAMLSAEYQTLNKEIRAQVDESIASTVKLFAQIFQQGMDEGDFDPQTDKQQAAYAFLSLLMGGHLIARGPNGTEELFLAAEEYIRVLNHKGAVK